MEDLEFSEDGIIGHIDWINFFDELPAALEMEPPIVLGESPSAETLSNLSPDSISSWINEIENVLMQDDEDKGFSLPSDDCCDTFLAHVLVDSHAGASGADAIVDVDSNASDCGNDFNNYKKDDEDKVSSIPTGDYCGSLTAEELVDSHGRSSGVDAAIDVDSNASDCGDNLNNSQKEKVDAASTDDNVDEDADDSISKKRRRYCY